VSDRRVAALTGLTGAPAGAGSWWRAPGRVNLIGDHTDYCDGFVFPMAIDRDCLLVATPGTPDPAAPNPAGSDPASARARVSAVSADREGAVDVAADGSDDPATVEPSWGRFVAGTVAALADRGALLPARHLALASTVPLGSGLSSSSALAVVLTLALADAAGLALDRRELARTALDAEVRATGVPGGLMDQLAALFGRAGHALLIDCRSLAVEPVPLPRSLAVVVVHSGLPRTLAESAYAERRAVCEAAAARIGVATLRDASAEQVRDDPRARHVVGENARVLEFVAALRAGDVNALGPLLLASHASLRDDFEVSTPELDLLVELLVESGAIGARLTGAGFGGCVVALVRRNHADDLAAKAVTRYRAETGLEPTAFTARAVDAGGPVDPTTG
jgi:galactokinase